MTDEGVCALARNCPHLTFVVLSGIQQLTDRSIISLANGCSYIEELYVSGCYMITRAAIRYLVVRYLLISSSLRCLVFTPRVAVLKNFKWPNLWNALSDSLHVCTVHRPYFAHCHTVQASIVIMWSVCLSVTKCIVGKLYILQQVRGKVNRKCHLRNTILRLTTPYTKPCGVRFIVLTYYIQIVTGIEINGEVYFPRLWEYRPCAHTRWRGRYSLNLGGINLTIDLDASHYLYIIAYPGQ